MATSSTTHRRHREDSDGKNLTALPLSEFREVVVRWGVRPAYKDESRHVVHRDDVDTFVQTQVELHHSPGINPYNNRTTRPICEITVGRFEARGPHWWTTPGLGKTPGAAGATLLDASLPDVVWQSPSLKAEIEAEQRDILEQESPWHG